MRLRYLVVGLILFGYVYYVHAASQLVNSQLQQLKHVYLELPVQIAQQK